MSNLGNEVGWQKGIPMSVVQGYQKEASPGQFGGAGGLVETRSVVEGDRLLRLIADRSPILMAYCGPDLAYKFVNKPYAERFGMRPEEIVGMTMPDLLGPEAFASIEPYVTAALQGERVEFEVEVPYRNIGSPYLWAIYDPEVDESGKVLGFVAIGLDVSKSKKAEEVLRESEERLRLALDGARIGMWSTDLGTGATECTPLAREIFGVAPESPPPTREQWLACIHPEDLERALGVWAEKIKQGAPYTLEYRIVRPDGEVRWVDTRGKFQFDAKGKPVRLTGITMDITERKRAERELRENEAYFHALADATPNLVWTARPDGAVEYCNSRVRQYYGIVRRDDEGIWDWSSTVHEEDRERTLMAWETAVREGEVYECEHRLKLADGSFRWHLSRGVPLKNESGELIKWFGTATDIHDLRVTEQELRENDKRKDEFLAMLAHELRNPLAPICNALHALKKLGAPEPQAIRLRDTMDRQVNHLTRLVDDLLDVSRITRNKITLHKESLELAAVVTRAIEVSRPLIVERRHRLSVSLPTRAVRLEGDMVRLAQMLSNLLNNAAKYTPEGGEIWVTAELTRGEVAIRVKDSGIGIPPQAQPYVFDLFTQGDRTPDRSQGGLGIGLTLVRRLAELHGGHVDVRSAGPGAGSEFEVRLPASEAESKREAPAPATATEAHPANRRRILVVDDNADAAETMAMLLEFSGHEVRMSYEGLAALETARAFRPHAVLLDIGLPGIDGYEVARRMRGIEETKNAFLIAVTGYGKTEDRIKALTSGFNYHITKPVDPAELEIVIQSIKIDHSDNAAKRRPGDGAQNNIP
jgi:PAS domain S-box-containing protein